MPRSPRYINQGVIGPELVYIMCNPSLSPGLGFFPHGKIKVMIKQKTSTGFEPMLPNETDFLSVTLTTQPQCLI